MTVYELIREAFQGSNLVAVPNALERFSCSIGCHALNIVNSRVKMFYHKSKVMNFREHIVFLAPSGFTKSIMLDFFLHPTTGLLSKCSFPVDVEATFTQESWMGTKFKTEDGVEDTNGVFARFQYGILGADEYARLKTMAENPGEANDVVYLLKALDDGKVSKNMAYGDIDFDNICMTFWCGLRPTSLRFTSGLGRRFTYQVYFPTWNEAQELKAANIGMETNTSIPEETKDSIRDGILEFMATAGEITEVDVTQIDDWVMNNSLIPHFDIQLYKRLAIGWSIVNGTYPDIILDDTLIQLLKDEFASRRIIRNNPVSEALLTIIRDEEDGFEKKLFYNFLDYYYQMPRRESKSIVKSLKMQELLFERDGKYHATEEAMETYEEEQQRIQDFVTLGGVV